MKYELMRFHDVFQRNNKSRKLINNLKINFLTDEKWSFLLKCFAKVFQKEELHCQCLVGESYVSLKKKSTLA